MQFPNVIERYLVEQEIYIIDDRIDNFDDCERKHIDINPLK